MPSPLLPGTLKNVFFPPEKDQYTYFASARQYPFTRDAPPIVKAAWAADASMLCYARYGETRMTDNELAQNLARGGLALRAQIGGTIGDWNAPGTQAFFATSDDFAILAFRGTEIDDPADAHSDIDILLVHEPEYRGAIEPPTGHFSLTAHLFTLPCLVHRGFQAALDDVWDQVYSEIADYRKERPKSEICITGHSLGGALALLAYSRLADPHISAFTMGCPRVGDQTFRDRVRDVPGRGHFRCVNFNDLVTHVPLESALYAHAPEECQHFDNAGVLGIQGQDALTDELKVFGRLVAGLPADVRSGKHNWDQPAPPGLVDHSPARYCMRLWDCATSGRG
jgi:hypothetical protein